MASVFKKEKRKGSPWYIDYFDETGRRRRIKGCADRAATEQIARKLETDVELRRRGVFDTRDDAYRTHEARPLADHLADWHRDMQARGKTIRHADQYRDRAGKLAAMVKGARLADLEPGRRPEAMERADRYLAGVLDGSRLSDLTPERIQAALAALRDAGKANQTANHYRAALRAFVRWAWEKGRLRESPMRGVSGYNADEDQRHVRRGLTDEELSRLIRAAERGPESFGMPGPLRAMAYRVAAATGFRAEELRSLAPENFRLEGPEPSVFLRAGSTKNRKPADQPIPLALARDLRPWLRDKPAGTPVLPLHHETAKAIRCDLEAAGIPYETDEGMADFHSLRSVFISALVRSGASIAEVRKLARHAKPETTLKHYAKVAPHDLRRAVEALPTPAGNGREPEALAATGTDPAPTASQNATATQSGDPNDLEDPGFAPTIQAFAKPLGSERALGGSNPPLSAQIPSGTASDRRKPSPSGGCASSAVVPYPGPSRQQPTATVPPRPPPGRPGRRPAVVPPPR